MTSQYSTNTEILQIITDFVASGRQTFSRAQAVRLKRILIEDIKLRPERKLQITFGKNFGASKISVGDWDLSWRGDKDNLTCLYLAHRLNAKRPTSTHEIYRIIYDHMDNPIVMERGEIVRKQIEVLLLPPFSIKWTRWSVFKSPTP